MPLSSGTHLGPYEILAQLGAGGMGEVYKARDTRLDRTVAIKVSKQEFTQRFEREARTIAALNHIHICQLYDVGPNYLVMELIDGQPLKGPLPLEKALEYAGQILDALDAAHGKGITHRDLKPANIVVTRQGVKLLDFGLAKSAGTGLKETDATVTSALTSEGQILGTLQYMSPEQLQGHEADARSDIFAFGCVLYEMLTGKRAFDGASAASVIAAIIDHEPPSIGSVAPAGLDRIVRRSLKKDPEQRWQSARDLKLALELVTEAGIEEPHPKLSPRSQSWPWIAAGAGIILAAVMSWAPWRHAGAVAAPTHFQISAPPGTQFILGAGGGSAISPDGRAVAFVAGGAPRLWIRRFDSVTAHELPGTEGAHFPFWSPDSQSLGFFAGGKLKRVDVSGEAVVILADAPSGRGGTWNRDGTILFAPFNFGVLRRVSMNGGVPVPVTSLDTSTQETGHRFPHFLPDGKRFICSSTNSQPNLNRIFLGSLDHPAEKTWLVTTTSGADFIPAHGDRSAQLLWFRQGTLIVSPFDVDGKKLTGELSSISKAPATTGFIGYAGFSASSDGTILFSSGSELNRLAWFTRDGKRLDNVGQGGSYVGIRMSPDATRVGVQVVDSSGGRDAYTIDLGRGIQTRVTSGNVALITVWSPDSRRIAYAPLNGRSIYERNSSGAGPEDTIYTSQEIVYVNDWSPDSRNLLIEELASGHGELRMLSRVHGSSGGEKPIPYLKSSANLINGQFSPDGKFVAYTSDESGQSEIYVQTFPASEQKWQISPSGGNFARWRRDGKEMVYLALDNRLMSVTVRQSGANLEFSTPIPLLRISEPIGPHACPYDITPDAQRILALTPNTEGETANLNVLLNWQTGPKP
jgi:Tol biopolymer transport system component/tRNA A-37 threonylcarbamoyl transferase component Bud32